MVERVVSEAQYVVQQLDGATLVSEEFLPATMTNAEVSARAAELEALSPALTTTWYFRGEVTESIELPGTVVERMDDERRFFDIDGATAATATLNGADLPLVFMAENPQSGDVIQFFDQSGAQVAELIL